MESRCYLVISGIEYLIDEPIGMDSFSTKIKRSSDAHGIAFEFSETTLEFYGYAYTLLKSEYDILGVNSVVSFKAEMKWTDNSEWDEYYYGKLDFKTYSETISDFNKISINPSRQTLEETISNRKDLEVALNTIIGMDGTALPYDYASLQKEITLKPMEINLTSRGVGAGENVFYTISVPHNGDSVGCGYVCTYYESILNMSFPISKYTELGQISTEAFVTGDPAEYLLMTYAPLASRTEEAYVNLKLKGKFKVDATKIGTTDGKIVRAGTTLMSLDINGNVIILPGDYTLGLCDDGISTYGYSEVEFSYTYSGILTIPIGATIKLYCAIYAHLYNSDYVYPAPEFEFSLSSDSYFGIQAISTFDSTTAKGAMIHEAASRVIEIITDGGLSVKSNYYSRIDSNVKHQLTGVSLANTTGLLGYGSMRALFNGYQIRKSIKSDGVSEYYISITWKDLIEQLQAIDNVGYGIEYDAVNGDVLRIEDWRYFYNDSIIFTITSPNKKVRTINTSELFSKFECGYSTWESEEYNGQDAFLTSRTYRTETNIIDNTLSRLCKWITDGYAIEATRRKILDANTKDYKYDEKVFIVTLSDDGTNVIYESKNGVVNGINLISPLTVYNAMISPIRIAMRWANRILQILTETDISKGMKFLSGTGNYIAGGQITDGISTGVVLENSNVISSLYDDSTKYTPILKPETIECEYPMSVAEYNIVKLNPLGIVLIDNEITHIKELTYKFAEGKAQFILIPTY